LIACRTFSVVCVAVVVTAVLTWLSAFVAGVIAGTMTGIGDCAELIETKTTRATMERMNARMNYLPLLE
jgi:hypothetical protein